MTSIQDRHKFILDELSKNSFIRVQDIADKLHVTGATIRKDFRILESQHLIYRNHGSASPVKQKVIDLSVQEKAAIHSTEKKKIAIAASKLIAEDDSIIMTSGTTIEAMAHHLMPKKRLNVVTPSIRVGVTLSEKENVEVIMLGGRLVKNSLSVRDTYTLEGLKNIKCSKLFLSCDGFDIDSGISTAFIEEARVTNAMMDAANCVILLADSSKAGKIGFGKICDFSRIDIFITDSSLSKSIRSQIEAQGVKVILA